MHGCGESNVAKRSLSNPALDTQELGGEVNTAILLFLGLAQGYIMRGDQPAM